MVHGNRATDGSGLQRLAFVVLVCFVSYLPLVPSASAEQLNEARLNQLAERVATSRRELTSLRRTLEQQERATVEARNAFKLAEYRLRSAQRSLQSVLDVSLSAQSASKYLSGTGAALNELRARRAALGDSEEAAVLDAQIAALQEQLNEEASRYGSQSNSRLDAIDQADQEVREAGIQVKDTRQAMEEALSAKNATVAAIGRVQELLGTQLEAMAEESDKVAPAWLQGIEVTQDGDVIYRASWSPDGSVKQALLDLIEEQQRERDELLRIRGLIEADIQGYSSNADLAYSEVKRLMAGKQWNDAVVLAGDRLWNLGQVALLFATGAQVVGPMYQSIRASGTLFSRAALAEAAGKGVSAAAEQVSLTSMPSFLKWPEYANQAARYVGITSRVWSYKDALANSWRGTEAVAALVTAYQLGEGGYKLGSGNFFADTLGKRHDDPDQRRFEGILRRSLQQVESFEVSHREFLVRHNLRNRYSFESEAIANRAYTEILNQINAEESDFWHTIGIGYITTSSAEIAGAIDQAGLIYYRAMQRGNGALINLAMTEIEDLDKAVAQIDARIEELQGELAGPDVRKLTVAVTEELHVRDNGVGEISLTFSQPLTVAPQVKIGAGPAVAYDPNADSGDGLPLPDINGAVNAEMVGQGKRWTGTFPLKPLQNFVDSGDALPIEVTARDAAGRALDANPRSAARRRPGQRNWYYNEPDFATSVLGQGGPDRWHELKPRFEGGTSYVFVIDGSGSMDKNERMVQVKRSARSFLGNMTDRDEVAVVAFFDCTDIQVLQTFTRDHGEALSVIDALEPKSDTPLAKAILYGGDYLLDRGHYDKRALIVLTDGAESCDGDPVAAAALFRRQATILGDVTNSRADNEVVEEAPPATTSEPEEPENVPQEEKVAVRPDDRDAWNVEVSDGGLFPTISIVRTHFREWGIDGSCSAQVTEEIHYAYYGKVWQPDGSSRTGFGINRRAMKKRTLDFARCSSGQARMDRIRTRWSSLDGADYETARAQAKIRADKALSP